MASNIGLPVGYVMPACPRAIDLDQRRVVDQNWSCLHRRHEVFDLAVAAVGNEHAEDEGGQNDQEIHGKIPPNCPTTRVAQMIDMSIVNRSRSSSSMTRV
jgi:hypothetical protein